MSTNSNKNNEVEAENERKFKRLNTKASMTRIERRGSLTLGKRCRDNMGERRWPKKEKVKKKTKSGGGKGKGTKLRRFV